MPALSLPRFLLPLLGAALVLTACDSQRSTTEMADPATMRSVPTEAVSFRKEVTDGDHRFVVQTTGEGSQRQLMLRAEKNGRELTTTRQPLNGQVSDVVVTNLNEDNSPELLIFVADAGSGSYGQLLGYEFMNQGRRPVDLPDLSGPAAQGYQGHDEFKVVGHEVQRMFPIYQPADANCCPSGGTRTVRYTLPPEGLTLQQVAFADQK
ncbi:hypothetical protein F1C16_05790 [Hymenobacter sp. NBH84]|uniref:Uncharacterized protein n=1 Tax=Hymenobacter defluvii TaxID=2054411 RepID=A0ABS3T700_9BACT|nr:MULTISPECIES: hypothetical protein [Hymenobacter]MBO3269426.1 hypothetical protein [Hymenobacter defluvii]QNE39096.1 hypothetical protein F1C16_05790 [Hymenobacter sp. NBH84]